MSVTARYRNGALLTYSLIAYSPWEGYRVAITGTKGRIEFELSEKVGRHFRPGEEDNSAEADAIREQFTAKYIRVYPMFGLPYEVDIPEAKGGHGGADPVMLEQIFATNPPDDPYKRAASHLDGAASILLGVAANQSIAENKLIVVDDLLTIE